MNNGFPKYNKSCTTGESGINAVSTIVNDHFGWIFRRNHDEHDFGIDGYLDVVSETGAVTGQCFAVQVKSGDSFFKVKTQNGFTFYGKRKHLNYYLNLPMPVLIILHNERNKRCYWELFEAHRTEETRSGWKMNIPKRNVLSIKSKRILKDIVGPAQDHMETLEAHWAFNKALASFESIHYAIDRKDIESKNIDPILEFFNRIQSNDMLCRKFQGRIEISVSGYDSDTRELWEIRDVRRWFKKVDDKINWFFFCSTKPPANGLRNYLVCMCKTRWLTPEEIMINPEANVMLDNVVQAKLLERNWPKLNEMTIRLGMSVEKNKKITYEVLDAFSIPHN